MTSIASGPSPDKLTVLDRHIDGQIGGLGTALENIIGTTRAVPLFEFRDLTSVTPSKMQGVVKNAEQAIIDFFNKYKTPPERKITKKNSRWLLGKRQNDIYGCATTTLGPSASATSQPTPSCTLKNEDPDHGIVGRGCICGSTTLSLLTVPSATDPAQSCSYTAIPTTTAATKSPLLRQPIQALVRPVLWWAVSRINLRVHHSRAALLQFRRQPPRHHRHV